MSSFKEKLDAEALAFFNQVCEKSFSEQATAFLNAYWNEVSSQAEFIFSVAFVVIKKVDMHSKGIGLVHQYNEVSDLDFDMGLYLYEQVCKFIEDHPDWQAQEFQPSMPVMMTALQRKTELREKVDVNFDGRVSMLEYLLYQYQAVANPADFVVRSMVSGDEHPEITRARLLLAEVARKIKEYETEKARLEDLSQGSGVKALGAQNMLAQLGNSPLAEELNKALITAEAAIRIATKKFGGSQASVSDGPRKSRAADFSSGSMWWLNRDLEEKKHKYGKKPKN